MFVFRQHTHLHQNAFTSNNQTQSRSELLQEVKKLRKKLRSYDKCLILHPVRKSDADLTRQQFRKRMVKLKKTWNHLKLGYRGSECRRKDLLASTDSEQVQLFKERIRKDFVRKVNQNKREKRQDVKAACEFAILQNITGTTVKADEAYHKHSMYEPKKDNKKRRRKIKFDSFGIDNGPSRPSPHRVRKVGQPTNTNRKIRDGSKLKILRDDKQRTFLCLCQHTEGSNLFFSSWIRHK